MNVCIKIFVCAFLFVLVPFSVLASDEYELSICDRINANHTYSCVHKTKSFPDSVSVVSFLETHLLENYEKGFISSGYDSIVFSDKKVNAWLTIGDKYIWDKLYLEIDTCKINHTLKLDKFGGKSLSLSQLIDIRREVVQLLENDGYPFCKVWFDNISFDNNAITASLEIDKGERYFLDSLIIKGDTKTQEKFIASYLNWPENTPYNEVYISKINQNLSDLEIVEQGKPFELAFRNEKTDILLYLKDRGSNNFSGILGIMPNNKVTGKVVITGDVDLMLKNIIGRGEHFSFNWKKYEASSQKLDVSLGYPFIFNTDLGVFVNFKLEKQDSSYLNTDLKAQINYFLNGFDGLGVFYQNINSIKLSNSDDDGYNNISSNLWGLAFYLQNLDYIYNPRKGYTFDISVAGGVKNHKLKPEENEELTSSLQARAILLANVYIPVFNRFSIKISEQGAYIYDQYLYANELYRIGGFKTFRGVDELSLIASAYSITSMEIRYLFEQNSAVYLFSDFAWYQNKTAVPEYHDIPYSFGLGLDLFTKAGIFSLNYGIAAQNGNAPDFKAAKIHIGYRNRF